MAQIFLEVMFDEFNGALRFINRQRILVAGWDNAFSHIDVPLHFEFPNIILAFAFIYNRENPIVGIFAKKVPRSFRTRNL